VVASFFLVCISSDICIFSAIYIFCDVQFCILRRYKLQILALQETKINEDGNIDIETTDGKYKYDLMYVGSKHHGVGIVADKDIKAEYKVI